MLYNAACLPLPAAGQQSEAGRTRPFHRPCPGVSTKIKLRPQLRENFEARTPASTRPGPPRTLGPAAGPAPPRKPAEPRASRWPDRAPRCAPTSWGARARRSGRGPGRGSPAGRGRPRQASSRRAPREPPGGDTKARLPERVPADQIPRARRPEWTASPRPRLPRRPSRAAPGPSVSAPGLGTPRSRPHRRTRPGAGGGVPGGQTPPRRPDAATRPRTRPLPRVARRRLSFRPGPARQPPGPARSVSEPPSLTPWVPAPPPCAAPAGCPLGRPVP